nr:hypothetical protein [Enterococcus faecium]
MLPFVIAGGIIIALSFAFGITAADPNSADYNVLAAADRKSTRLNSSHVLRSRMPSSA